MQYMDVILNHFEDKFDKSKHELTKEREFNIISNIK